MTKPQAMRLTDNVSNLPEIEGPATRPWKLLVVDDDHSVHQMTHLVLGEYQFLGRSLEFHDAYNSREAIDILTKVSDVAVVLLDVVMDTDDAGLRVVRDIRGKLGNKLTRIILRTGQPGAAPESQVIVDYDINDYKEKTELTTSRLFTSITTALRSYEDLCFIERSRQGLKKIIDASNSLFDLKSQERFTEGLLEQLTSILHLDKESIYLQAGSLDGEDLEQFVVRVATGKYAQFVGQPLKDVLDDAELSAAREIVNGGINNQLTFSNGCYVGYFKSFSGDNTLLLVHGSKPISQLDHDLIQIFSTNLAIAFDNLNLNKELLGTQREVIIILGEIVESRSKESANHVKRVAEYARLLALLVGLSEWEAELVRMAAPMHDVGKIAIPDAILNKPGRLTPQEREIMCTHAAIGKQILSASARDVMKAAGIIAYEHHEQWSGGGYPRALKGDEIHIFGRIVAIADVFDALICKRCYKDAWTSDDVKKHFAQQRGKHFDPTLTDLFLKNYEQFLEIHRNNPDNAE